jgi:hypothetical protein
MSSRLYRIYRVLRPTSYDNTITATAQHLLSIVHSCLAGIDLAAVVRSSTTIAMSDEIIAADDLAMACVYDSITSNKHPTQLLVINFES